MSKSRRSFSASEKLSIINEADQFGVTQTLRKHRLQFNFKKGDVIVLLSLLIMEYKIEGITLRNDNGSQFIAGVVRQFTKVKQLYAETLSQISFQPILGKKNPAIMQDLNQCPRLDSNQHAVSSATTSR